MAKTLGGRLKASGDHETGFNEARVRYCGIARVQFGGSPTFAGLFWPEGGDERLHAMKSTTLHIMGMLKRAGLYHRLRASNIHELWWRIAGKNWILAREKQLDFYRRLLTELRPGDLIFDIGANEGFKTDLFLRLGARVVAIEPDETNQSILREKFARFRLVRKQVVIVGKAVSDTNTVETMWIDGPGSAVNTLS